MNPRVFGVELRKIDRIYQKKKLLKTILIDFARKPLFKNVRSREKESLIG